MGYNKMDASSSFILYLERLFGFTDQYFKFTPLRLCLIIFNFLPALLSIYNSNIWCFDNEM